jgi:ribose transport system ATP-binding protein
VAALLECRDIDKGFGGVPVLRSVSLAFQPGTVTVLAGENGAGKSTLLKIISGQQAPDRGSVLVDGARLPAGDVHRARERGVGIVPQELAPIRDMRIYENLFVGREPRTRWRMLDRRRMVAEARSQLAVFGLRLDPRTFMRDLPVGLTQLVEIVKTTSWGARVLLLDEPTSAISDREVERLVELVKQLRALGVAIVYTTHKMAEIQALADRVVVLRDGAVVADKPIGEITPDGIVTAMIGRELAELFPSRAEVGERVRLEVAGLRRADGGPAVDLTVRSGEIIGLAGLVGAGRTELLEAIFGQRRTVGGEVRVDGRPIRRNRIDAAIGAGLAFVPEDRKGAGLVLSMSVLDNGTLPRLGSFSALGWLRGKARQHRVGRAMADVRLRSTESSTEGSRALGQEVGTLSGGNQQKVVLARWLTGSVSVLLLDEPTRGVDVGARGEIYRIIADLAAAGMSVLLASSDMAEVLGLADRVLVMRGGGITAQLSAAELRHHDAQERIFRHAAGLHTALVPAGAAAESPTSDSGVARADLSDGEAQ